MWWPVVVATRRRAYNNKVVECGCGNVRRQPPAGDSRASGADGAVRVGGLGTKSIARHRLDDKGERAQPHDASRGVQPLGDHGRPVAAPGVGRAHPLAGRAPGEREPLEQQPQEQPEQLEPRLVLLGGQQRARAVRQPGGVRRSRRQRVVGRR